MRDGEYGLFSAGCNVLLGDFRDFVHPRDTVSRGTFNDDAAF